MATANLSSVSQQPLPIQNTCTNEDDLIQLTFNIIKAKTGNPPANADHVYDLMQQINEFPHPCPTVTDNTGGTLPTQSSRPIAQTLQGWEDVSPQESNSIYPIFHHVGENDQRLAYDQYCRELGRAPTVKEFSNFLLTFEGQLYLENKKSKKTTNEILQTMSQFKQMLRIMDSQNKALGQRNDQYKREMDNLQSEIRNQERTICNFQHQKEDQHLEFNSLKRKHYQHLAELEDERKDKQQLQAERQELQNALTSQTDTITHLSETVAYLERKTEQQSVTISDLESKNSDLESKNSDLESKTEQQSVTISDLESKNSDLESKTEQQSVTISDLGSKNSDLESKNSDLESKTEQQSFTISDLESKNSDLESKTEQQSVTISDLGSKNSDLESKTRQQSTTITAIQQQNQRQQYFILFLAALYIFAMVCFQFFSQDSNPISAS